jgi:hypothetical protein
MHEGVVGARDERPQATGRLAELLVDDDLLEDRPALAADVGRERPGDEARFGRRLADPASGLGAEVPTRALEFELERLKNLTREATRSILELELSGAERQVHRGKDGARGKRLLCSVAGRGTSFAV